MLISNNYIREIFDYDCMLEALLTHFYMFYRNKDTLYYTQCISDFKGLIFKIQKNENSTNSCMYLYEFLHVRCFWQIITVK